MNTRSPATALTGRFTTGEVVADVMSVVTKSDGVGLATRHPPPGRYAALKYPAAAICAVRSVPSVVAEKSCAVSGMIAESAPPVESGS